MKRLFAVFFLLLSLSAYSQPVDFLYARGKEFYDNNQYREALYYLRRFIAADTSHAEAFKWRGNCYLALNQPDSALLDYEKALSMTQEMPELYYNISNAYAGLQNAIESEKYLRRFLRARPDDIDGIIQLVSFLQVTRNDSVLHYLERAHAIDTVNQFVYNSLGWEYMNRGKYDDALAVALRSRRIFRYTNELLPLEAYAWFALGDFNKSSAIADSLVGKSPEPMPFYVLKAKSEILRATKADVYVQDGHMFRFRWIRSPNTARLDSAVRTAGNPYLYSSTVQKFEDPRPSAGLDEIFMAYYGYTTDTRYAPYAPRAHNLQQLFEEEDYEAAIAEARDILAADPFNLRVRELLALAEYQTKRFADFEISLRRYVGLMESILATGTGMSPDSAFIVTSPAHEYEVVGYLGGESVGQSLLHHDGHAFDVLKVRMESGNEENVYFNIDKPMTSLRAMFDETERRKSKKDGKRTKKARESRDD